MATKTISITEEAYERLATKKNENESFSDIILKLFPKHSLLELAGLLTNKEAEELKEVIKSRRVASRKRLQKIAKNINDS